MLQGIPPELLALLQGQGQDMPTQNSMLEAIKNAMAKRVSTDPTQRLTTSGYSASPAEISESENMESLRNEPMLDDLGQYSPAPYRRDRDPNLLQRETDPNDPYRPGGDYGPARDPNARQRISDAGSYEERPGEDKAARMAADAVEGKGVKYDPTDSGMHDDDALIEADRDARNILSVWDEGDDTFQAETDMDRDEALEYLKELGVSQEKLDELDRRR